MSGGVGRLELGLTFLGHLCLPDIKLLEFFQSGQRLQSGVGDRRAVNIQVLEIRQSSKLRKAGIGDLRLLQVEFDQALETLEVLQSFVGDFGFSEIQLVDDIGQRLHRRYLIVAHLALGQMERNVPSVVVLSQLRD